jgi:hypothetical protein
MYIEKCLVSAVREAIDHKVDAISLSLLAGGFQSRAYTNILKEAAQKGIALIFCAGNESTHKSALYLGNLYFGKAKETKSNSNFYKRHEKTAFEELKGKNMLFCGALGHSETGEEFLSEFSEHPANDTLMRYVVAPGQNLFFAPLSGEWITADTMPREGTSYSTPITAGGFALLKQYAKDKGLVHTNDDLLGILQTSGHNLNHSMPGTFFKTYKALNLKNAVQAVDRLANQPKHLPPAKKAVVQLPKKQATLAPKGPIIAKKVPVQIAKKSVSVAPKGRVAVKKAPVQIAKRQTPVIRKGPVAAKKVPVAKKSVSLAPKGRVVAKKVPVQIAKRQTPVVRKGPVAAKKVPVAKKPVSLAPKGRVVAKKVPVQIAKRQTPVVRKGPVAAKKVPVAKKPVSLAPKGPVAVKKAPVQKAIPAPKGRAVVARKVSPGRRNGKNLGQAT